MGTLSGANIVKNGLVFGYDTGYGAANNDVLTKYYQGEPTENILALGGSDTEVERSGTSYPYYSINIDPYIQERWTPTNNVLTLSYEGKRNFLLGGSGGGNDGYPVYYIYFTDWSWASTRGVTSYDWAYTKQTFTMPDPTSKSVRFAIYHMNSGNRGRSYSRKHKLEFNNTSTPFVNGVRRPTQSLIELTKTTNIDVSNISFDSTGQPTFDGSDDYIDLGSDVIISPNSKGWTAEYVFNTNSASTLQHFNSAESDDFNANWLAILSSKLAVWDHGQGTWRYGDTVFSSNTWYHIVFVQTSPTTMQFYVNGVPEGGDHTTFSWSPTYSSLKTRYVGRYEYNGGYGRYFNGEIPVTKMYNRPLSIQEVQQNFNAYKNRFNL